MGGAPHTESSLGGVILAVSVVIRCKRHPRNYLWDLHNLNRVAMGVVTIASHAQSLFCAEKQHKAILFEV